MLPLRHPRRAASTIHLPVAAGESFAPSGDFHALSDGMGWSLGASDQGHGSAAFLWYGSRADTQHSSACRKRYAILASQKAVGNAKCRLVEMVTRCGGKRQSQSSGWDGDNSGYGDYGSYDDAPGHGYDNLTTASTVPGRGRLTTRAGENDDGSA